MNEKRYYKITDENGQSVTFYKNNKLAQIDDTVVSIHNLDIQLLKDKLGDIKRVEGTTSADSDFHQRCSDMEDKIRGGI